MIMAQDMNIKVICRSKTFISRGIVRDKLGRKMSKSLGNSPEPLERIEQVLVPMACEMGIDVLPLPQETIFYLMMRYVNKDVTSITKSGMHSAW